MLTAHAKWVRTAAFSPEGMLLATGSYGPNPGTLEPRQADRPVHGGNARTGAQLVRCLGRSLWLVTPSALSGQLQQEPGDLTGARPLQAWDHKNVLHGAAGVA